MAMDWMVDYQPKGGVSKWIDQRLPLPRLVYNTLGGYPTPKNLNYFWNFGSLAGMFLVIQIVTGIVLAMHYSANTLVAFNSVEHIMRDVNYGWLIRYLHMNGASFFFIVVYIHIFRGLYYGSYKEPREMLWILGVVIMLLMMATAFMGYVLKWGQMSYWGAKVITGLFSAIPLVGTSIQTLLVGGPVPDNYTLNRFFSLHYLLPFVIVGVVILHIWALHIPGSNNPLGIDVKGPQDTVSFHPYYTIKDLFGVCVALFIFCIFVFFTPDLLGDPDNSIMANPMATPAHIKPEWYFWPFYGILRAFTFDFLGIPAKLWGVLAMFSAIMLLFVLPWLDNSPVRSANFRPIYRQMFIAFVVDIFILGWCGGSPAAEPYVIISRFATAYYFIHFLVLVPIVARLETPVALPKSIGTPVFPTYGNLQPAE